MPYTKGQQSKKGLNQTSLAYQSVNAPSYASQRDATYLFSKSNQKIIHEQLLQTSYIN